ncbi:MAG: YkgJ family cysteine cluster protein [Treponema sp.]|nr:YkgJ family cysteine cluster protein [Treponema sp.]
MNSFYENGLQFGCKRCSGCCGKTPGVVYLSKKDLHALCAFFEMTAPQFIETYCKKETYYEGKTVLALQSRKNNDCILWKDGCIAYEARPIQCSTYPFWEWIVRDKAMWDDCARDCPGMNSGRVWTKQEIESSSKQYAENVPLQLEES